MSNYDQCKKETEEHIVNVTHWLNKITTLASLRGPAHDRSKLYSPEIDAFANVDRHTSATKYGTPEYQAGLDQLRPALNNHYAKNRHHPEHYPNGVKGMNLIDILEMLCDWKASCQRYKEGNILTSIEVNVKKFNISDDLAAILRNTAELFELV
jgi:hypothetical protein